MKTFKRTFLLIAVAAMLMPLLDSCKKGKEDPGISFRSRNARVTGTWTLKSYEMSGVTDTTITRTNDVNDDDYSYTSRTTWSETYNGNSVVTSSNTNTDYTDQYEWYDITPTPQWRDQEKVYEYNSKDNDNTTWSFTISLYTDNTYEIEEISGNASGSWEWDFDLDYENNNDPLAVDDDNDLDNDWSTTGTSTSVSQGAWYWEDNTKKNKLYLNAGPIKGQVIRLSNKEMIVEIQYGALNSIDQELGYEGEGTSNVGENTVVLEDWPILEYDDNNPLDTDDGDITTVTKWNNSETIGRWVFEKTDKNSKRHKAGSTE